MFRQAAVYRTARELVCTGSSRRTIEDGGRLHEKTDRGPESAILTSPMITAA
jgi:hypothetical protein